jgi:acyl-CoA synthetase (AMP-forming)/AMP-acid ligase II
MAGSGEAVTYRELDECSNQVAQAFRDLGLRPGDVIAFALDNSPVIFDVAWGAQRAGLYMTAVNWHLTAAEAAYIINDSGATVLIVSEGAGDLIASLDGASLPQVTTRVVVGAPVDGWASYAETVARQPKSPIPDEVEGDILLYSSGTTGRPKGIKRPLPGLPMGEYPDMPGKILRLLGMQAGDRCLSTGPLYHTAPLGFCMAAQRIGGTVVAMERFDAEQALRLIGEHRVTHSQWVPTMFSRMLRLPEDVRASVDLSSHRAAVHAAAPCPIPVKQAMIDWWGPIVYEFYSMTEALGSTFITTPQWLERPGSVGRAAVGEIHILDEEGLALPRGEAGTIWFEGAPRFEYLNDPEKTKDTFNDLGYGTVGDVGYLDDDGFLFITDRKANLIISGGVNIYPQEVENLLQGHPAIQDVAVIGVPNEEFGEEVKAVVQLVDPESASDALAQELIAYCRGQLASFKCPRSVDFDRDLPRQPSGKLLKRVVRDRYWPNGSRV